MSQISALIAANSLPQLATPLIDAAAQAQNGAPASSGQAQSPNAPQQDSVTISPEAAALSASEG